MGNNITKHPLYEKLLKEFHPTKNGDLKLSDFSHGSNVKVWWKCYDTKFDDHEWEATINDRFNKHGCSCCSGRRVVLSNCLMTTNSELCKEWDYVKNGELTPFMVTAGSNKMVHWKCFDTEFDDHEWKTKVSSRVEGNECSCCSGHKVVLSNCLATVNPMLAAQLLPTKNGNLTAYDITAHSGKKVWWFCTEAIDHEWQDTVCHRADGRNCSCCRGMKIVLSNCFATTHPEKAKQWHPTKNGNLTPYMVTSGSHKNIIWKCDVADDHEWQATINSRTHVGYKNECSCCANCTVVLSNCLATTHPEEAKKWHPTKNGKLTPYEVTAGSNKKVWWMGECNHEWRCCINDKTNGSGCKICNESKGEKAVANF